MWQTVVGHIKVNYIYVVELSLIFQKQNSHPSQEWEKVEESCVLASWSFHHFENNNNRNE